jgi:AmmeMemoRadiSam system protein B
MSMILARMRSNLDVMPSPIPGRPGLFIRDNFRYSDARLIIPPGLLPGLACFDGNRSDADLLAELTRHNGAGQEGAVRHLCEALDKAGFLVNETYAALRETRHRVFAESPEREPAHTSSAYPAELGPLQKVMRRYLDAPLQPQVRTKGIAAPHVSPEGGWQSYRAAYQALTPEHADKTFVILGTSHFGAPNMFGVTRKSFRTPFGLARTDVALAEELAAQPAAVTEDYSHAIEHSIEFQVLFLQAVYGPDVKILPVLCGSFGQSIHQGGLPEDDDKVNRFMGALGDIAEREGDRVFWVLGVDMAHMGARYRDGFVARAGEGDMQGVNARDLRRIDRINAGDVRGYWDLTQENRDDLKWCGSSPFYTFLRTVPQARGTLRRYEQWNIDDKSVVSFAGITFA